MKKEFLHRFTIDVMGEDIEHARDRLEQDISDTIKAGNNVSDLFDGYRINGNRKQD